MTLTRRVRRLLKIGRRSLPRDPAFDPAFYLAQHPDLKSLRSDDALHEHFVHLGRAEGRPGNVAQYYAALEAEFGPLPADFDPVDYREMHADVCLAYPHPWQAARHYLIAGRQEKRDYAAFDADLYRSLYFPDTVITDYELSLDYKQHGRSAGRVGSWRRYLEPSGLGSAWVFALKVDEFELLNSSWCGPVRTRLDAVKRMVDEGVDRLAPISFELIFDPDFYRDARPEFAQLTDAQLYRRWLGAGLAAGDAPNAEAALKAMGLALTAYPESFDWQGYARAQGLAPANRWTVLRQLMDVGLEPEGAPPLVKGVPPVSFLAAFGDAMRERSVPATISAYETARAFGDRSYDVAHHLADAYFRSDRWAGAASLFWEAARYPHAEAWTYVNGALACARAGRLRAALTLLRRSKARFAGEPAWRRAVGQVIELDFMRRTARARRLYRLGPSGRQGADAQVTSLIARARRLWSELDPIGAPIPAAADGRVVMLANLDIPVCVHYRVEQKREIFEILGRPLEVYGPGEMEAFLAALPGATAAIFFRLAAWPSVARAIDAARTMGVPTYYEMDDLTFDAEEYPDTLESYGGLIDREHYEALQFGVPLTREAVALCDYGISSTLPLARALQPLVRSGQVFWLPNGLDSRNEDFLANTPVRVRQGDEIVIAYASGTTAHNSDFHQLATPALIALLKRNPKVRFMLVGYLALTPEYDEVRDQIIRLDYVNGSAAFWSLLADADINIAVLKSTWATDSKSEIKWLEAAALGVPSVVSTTAMYREVIEDGVDGLIAATVEDWHAALERLVADADERRRIGSAARAKADRQYSLEANARRMRALLLPADDQRAQPASPAPALLTNRRARVLLANVWFPPQSIGGATRVVRNNLDAWLDQGLDKEFEFMVVTSDHNAEPPYRKRVDSYRDVPVFRISTPMRPNMDWRPEDPEIGAIFAELIDSWRPDLAHFHAVQRLTASVVEETKLAGVPYLCTTHDAWWLSDWHFLTDDDGRSHAPCEYLPTHPPAGVSVSQALDRRRRLKAALDGAAGVLAVSDSFADIYRNCGVRNVISVPNGLPPMPGIERTRSANGKVRLAHVGNVAKHKGFHLIQAALRQSAFKNLELTVVDHGAPTGSVVHTQWGATPVRFIGKREQDRIHELYAEVDVLLAPSTWPESFGLVTREALSYGCWVVASDRGAISEDVVSGVNGFVVDVSTPEGLLGALREIDANPEKHLKPPAVRPPLRTADDQAKELIALYRDVLARHPAAPHPANGRSRWEGRVRASTAQARRNAAQGRPVEAPAYAQTWQAKPAAQSNTP